MQVRTSVKTQKNNESLVITLHAKHKEILSQFSERSSNIDQLKDELLELKSKLNKINSLSHIDLTDRQRLQKYSLENQIDEITNEIYNLTQNREKNDYSLKAMGHLEEYYQETKNRGDIVEEYFHTIDPSYIPKNKQSKQGNTYCSQGLCNEVMTLNHLSGTYECYACGATKVALVEDSRQNYTEGVIPQDNNCFSYKKITHLMECIEQCQGKERTEIPKYVFDQLLHKIKCARIIDKSALTNDLIKGFLRELNLNNFFEHIPYIQKKLKGQKPPEIPDYLEERIIKMFKDVQIAFKKCRPDDRKNFPSYSYVLHKCIQLIGDHDELLAYFPLLKSKNRLQEIDNIWKNICLILNWDFIPSC